jgi:tetratricopeptide (TPR) repeat protein
VVHAVDRRAPRTTGRGELEAGDQFGPRYHVTKLLGVGGMGAVYQAWDNELNMAVALKIIKPTYASAAGRDTERLFKRELVLARQVTHKNVIRIHDLGEVEGMKYISMPFVDGSDLAHVLAERGQLPVTEALDLAKQIASGLAAAHEVGVVHRDLKPANILVGADAALITDFGIAHSLSGPAESGVVGTLRYMAPEQARGLPVDHRADVYAFGLILFEMLRGRRWLQDAKPSQAGTGPGLPVPDDFEAQGDLPDGVNRVLARCLAVDPAKRYASAAMLIDDLGTLDDQGRIIKRPAFVHVPSSWPLIGGRMIARGTAAASLALLVAVPLVGAVAYVISARLTENALIQPEPVSILVADFENRTGEAVFDGVVEPALKVALEGASFISTYPSEDARRLSDQIAGNRRLDRERARVIAQREGIDFVIAGSIARDGTRYRIQADTIDPIPGTVLSSRSVAAAREGILQSIAEAASAVRGALGDTTPESARLSARETFTAASVEAASQYSRGQELLQASRYDESVPLFRRATELDPSFGRAFSSWAVAEYYLGRREETERLFKQAFALTDRMTEREKYRTFGTYYLTVAQAYQEAITNYSKLVELYPADRAGHGNLAVAYFFTLNFAKAAEAGRRALELYPASLKLRSNHALYAMYSGNFDAAAAEAAQVIESDKNYFLAYLPLAVAAIVKDPASTTAVATYERMAMAGPRGASLGAAGVADLALAQGRYGDAERTIVPAIAADVEAGDRQGAAGKQVLLAEALAARGLRGPASAAARRALALSRTETVMLSAARVLVSSGGQAAARQVADELSMRTEGYSRAYGLLLSAEIALRAGRAADAVDALRNAQKIADLWLVHHLLGVAYVEAKRYPEALAEFDVSAKRRGEAVAVFLDDVPTVRYLAPLPYWLGRAQEGMGLSAQAARSYAQFLSARTGADDALARDARARVRVPKLTP